MSTHANETKPLLTIPRPRRPRPVRALNKRVARVAERYVESQKGKIPFDADL